MTDNQSPPSIAMHVLQLFTPRELQDVLLGDLNEEFAARAQHNLQNAQRWYWQQTLKTANHYLLSYCASEDLLKKVSILIAVILFPALFLMISWLSNVDSTSEAIWQNLLAGKVHSFLFDSEVMINGFTPLLDGFDIDMYINTPSMLWALFSFCVLWLLNRQGNFSSHQAAAWGAILMLSPYLFGLIYIDLIQPPAKMLGPTIAFMSLSVFYILVPLAWFICHKSKQK